ncbi:MAG TPA: bifunctional glutamate N-acetyltransferase/amino-acid acetyltransferase ArgJ [Desulfobacteraceae bacterium]|nr:bifunctional glutamate N-acetyltransferase/amino-acid acetyltransferase ArgJ [Deltaproteobacteria bacterium]MBW2355385.1 bifunctional glutamate N-acetyltransferase/amino-acid acetyltransferase ArgJ [Deltaproteobacteria bacterium]HDI60262.1 bifunctional glutamate N-acetyltransferase/amino-acid acetyltransferase ArgJ [Desulfobacteraceae bacterium]
MERFGCPGFKTAGVHAGLKKNGALDLGLIYAEQPATAAGVFTRNLVQAAPVQLSRRRAAGGRCRAVIVNSKNANCCTGADGMRDAMAMTGLVAQALGLEEHEVLVASTGVIGAPLPMEKITAAVPTLCEALVADDVDALARSMMTTDTVPKAVRRRGTVYGRDFTVVGVAKGAGMIRPDMATMLCFLMTDAQASAGALQAALSTGVERSLNRITIDGDTSTNDTCLLLASGVSGARIDTNGAREAFQKVLDDVLMDLARRLVADGEGVTKVVTVSVCGAQTEADARRIVDAVAHSPLVKTAFFGQDANWGRILAAAGRAGAQLDPERLALFFDDVQMVRDGMGCGPAAEAAATAVLKKDAFTVTLDLGLGLGRAEMLTCDFSADYVKINADYRS